MSEFQTLRIQDKNQVRIITFNRPKVRNALSAQLLSELAKALTEAEQAEQVRAVILTGAGLAFCAGLDLEELKGVVGRSAEQHRIDSGNFRALLEKLYTFPKPTVAAVNGHAVAGGAGLACFCDITVMSEQAKIGFTEVKIGFVAALTSVLLVRLIGEKHARDLLLSGRLLSAVEAERMGLVNDLRPDEQVLPHALHRAVQMARNAPTSLMLTKKMLYTAPSMGLQEGLDYASEVNAVARLSRNLQEGVTAFLEERKPKW